MVNNYLIKLLKFHKLVICMPEIEFLIGLGIYEGIDCLGGFHLLGLVIFNYVQAFFFFLLHMLIALLSVAN
jgi:hypothetical protein